MLKKLFNEDILDMKCNKAVGKRIAAAEENFPICKTCQPTIKYVGLWSKTYAFIWSILTYGAEKLILGRKN
jgi:hypothetical protein